MERDLSMWLSVPASLFYLTILKVTFESSSKHYYVYGDGRVTNEIPDTEERSRSAILVPLKSENNVIGVLQVLSNRLDSFTEDNLSLVESISVHAAASITNALLYGRVRKELEERKEAEEKLRDSREQYRILVDNANEAIVVVQDGLLKFVNRIAFEILPGYSKEELVSKPFIDFVHPDDRARIANTFTDRLRGEALELRNQYRLIMRDGTTKWVVIGSALIHWEGKPATLSFISDITQEKKVEEVLRESELRFRTLIEEAPIAISVSRNGRFLYVNQKLRQLLGVQTQKEMIGRSVTDYFAPQSKEESQERTRLRSLGLPTPTEFESVGLRADGTQYPSLIQVSQVQLADGLANIAFVTDITERKKAETEAQRLREKAEISSRLAAVGELAAGIAHEINNPLTGVIGFSELLLEEDLPPDIKSQIKVIADGSHRVKDIVKRMLTIARQNKLVKTSVDINELIESTLELRSYILRTSNIEVIKHFDLNIPKVVVDPGQMQQVFLNLIVNAEHSMKKAHGRGILTLTTEKIDAYIRVSIQDDGIGIGKEVQTKLFNLFFTTKEVNEGTGLGLSLSRSIIMEHGGTIEVESEIDKGANFIILLPITPPVEKPEFKASATRTLSQKVKGARILVIDDEEPIRKLLSTILGKTGQTVETTGDAKEALVDMDINSYDVVLVDIRMPGMSGIELYNTVKVKRPELAGRFIFITGDISDENTKAFLEENELSFLSKPFDQETLNQKVKDIL